MMSNKVFTSAALVLGLFVVSSALTLQAGFFGELTISDTDASGDISAEELRAALDSARADVVDNYDTDGDGALSREERQAAALDNLDTDASGDVSREERNAAREATRATISAAFDSDGDGELSDTERETLHDTVAEARGDSGHGGRRGGNGEGRPEGESEN